MPTFRLEKLLDVSADPGADQRQGREAAIGSMPDGGKVTIGLSIQGPEGADSKKPLARVRLLGQLVASAPWIELHGVKSKSEIYQVPACPKIKAELLDREEGTAVRVDIAY